MTDIPAISSFDLKERQFLLAVAAAEYDRPGPHLPHQTKRLLKSLRRADLIEEVWLTKYVSMWSLTAKGCAVLGIDP